MIYSTNNILTDCNLTMASVGFAAKILQAQFPKSRNTTTTTNSAPTHFILKRKHFLCPVFSWKPRHRFVSLLSKCSSNSNSNVFQLEEEEGHNLVEVPPFSDPGLYSKELGVAVRAVHMACLLCQKLQHNLVLKRNEQVSSKDDNSPVTIADWSVQATVSWVLSEAFGSDNVSIVAEEDVQVLSKSNATDLLEAVVKTVNTCLAEAPRFGLKAPGSALRPEEVLEAIGRCNSTGGHTGRFWVLDPVDGTLGFVRGDQYAVALALIEDGEVVLGALGCPNYPMRKELLSYHNGNQRSMPSPTSDTRDKGCIMYAKRGIHKSWMQPLLRGEETFVWPNYARQIQVSPIDDPELATFCEPVEKANSSHSFTAGLAHSVGLRNKPLRVHSMVKYAAIARGDAEIFMKFARAGYKEKIWDHAAAVVIIQEAGGLVTDARGHQLDFSKGIYLEGLDRGIIACAGSKLHETLITAVDASWNSSSL